MKIQIGLVVLLGATSLTSGASAQDSGLELGARLGYGIPMGKVHGEENAFTGDGVSLSDAVSGQVPIQLDVGYRLDSQLLIGGYFQYGIAFPALDECDISGVSCSASNVRLGAQVTYHFAPITVDSAWLGGGIGYEWLNLSAKAAGITESIQVRGFEFLNVQGGYDFVLGDNFRLGPFAMLTLAQYGTMSAEAGGISVSTSDFDKAIHSWLVLGVKGSFGPI